MAKTLTQPNLDRPLPPALISEPTARPLDFLYLPIGERETIGVMPSPEEAIAIFGLAKHSDPLDQSFCHETTYTGRRPLSQGQLKIIGEAFSSLFITDVQLRQPSLRDLDILHGITDAITRRTEQPVFRYEKGEQMPTRIQTGGFILSRSGNRNRIGAFINRRLISPIHWGMEDIRLTHWELTRAYKAPDPDLNRQAKIIRQAATDPDRHLAIKATVGILRHIEILGKDIPAGVQTDKISATEKAQVVHLAERRSTSARTVIRSVFADELAA